ncbi:ComEC/Rec2 family competence protein [Campylobacter sp. 19-13652]|uniref:ComEC/Rec2 family competence protein n=1 Tax=Campylobacter sp. 19-13652 TaxID=2840180 RepID=UPI001C75C7BA|nr:ComEC/Rec2 family competence protein [Campylobacter sp. 19-13652]BCX79522.1 competence protein [Campylobacter sp. 19-13652]
MPIFSSRREIVYFAAFLAFIFVLNLVYEYHKYYKFIDEPEPYITGVIKEVIVSKKENKIRKFIKILSDDFELFSKVALKENYKKGDFIGLEIYTINIGFLDFLSRKIFVKSTQRHLIEKDDIHAPSKETYSDSKGRVPVLSAPSSVTSEHYLKALNFIKSQHKNTLISELYEALFLAQTPSKALRQSMQQYGANHLIAISGYHLSAILFLVFFLLRTPYMALLTRYFPYRDYRFDISVLAFLIVAFYAYFIGFVPSFMRALSMGFVGFYLLTRGIRILSFELFFVCVCALVALNLKLIFNVGFLFSCFGVWFIYLYLHHFKPKNRLVFAVNLNIYIAFCMTIITGYFFDFASIWQLSGLLLNFIFILFYPLAALLHMLGFGGMLDFAIEPLLEFKSTNIKSLDIPLWLLIFYSFLALIAPKYKPIALFLPSLGFGVWLKALLI